jgi:hypothetical protein
MPRRMLQTAPLGFAVNGGFGSVAAVEIFNPKVCNLANTRRLFCWVSSSLHCVAVRSNPNFYS